MTRAEIIAEAGTWIGTPWKHQAACKGAGADCIGLIAGIYANCGNPDAIAFLATPRSYGREPKPEVMFAAADEVMDRIPVADAGPCDVLIFESGRHPMHFGLIVEGGYMIHAWITARRVTKHRIDEQWHARIVRAYRPRGFES